MKNHTTKLVVIFFLLSVPLAKSQYYFGRNKIQYNQFQWHILKTDHFDIYFYPEMEALAEIGAYYAEESYRYLQDKFNHNLLKRIPLVFYSSHFHFEETNTLPYMVSPGLGGFFEFIKGRVVVPCDGSVDRFKQTIRHELVHVFQRSYLQRIFKDHRLAQGKSLPLWFIEGLAEYWSEGWSTEAEMVIRDGVLNNTIVPIQLIYQIYGTYLMYKEGQSILKFIAETYGEEKILRLHQNIWKKNSFSEVVKMTLGKDLKELDAEWLYSLKKQYYPLMADKQLPSMVSIRITQMGFNTLPAFHLENGTRKVIFLANRNGYSGIYQKSISDYGEDKPELLIQGEKTPELESFHLQKSRMDIDHDRLAFVAKSGPNDILHIYDLNKKRIVQKFKFPSLVSLFSPAWSPDGSEIAISGLDQSGKSDLYLIRVENGKLTRLTDDYYEDRDPDWSPDGKWLVFSSDRTETGEEGYTNLFLYDVTTSTISYLTFGRCSDTHPTWSADGNRIVFSSDRDGVPNIWIVERKTSESDSNGRDFYFSLYQTNMTKQTAVLKQVTRFATAALYPCWTDSLSILFTAFENMSLQIREVPNIAEKLQTIHPVQPDSLNKLSGIWAFPKISGVMKSSRVNYKRKFSLDIAQSQIIQDPIFGTSGGGEVLISDMLGNEQYYFLVYNNAQTRSEFWDGFNLAVTRVDLTRRLNFATGLYRLAGLYYNNYEGYFFERRYGGFATVSYPLNKFERLGTSVNIRYSDKNWYSFGQRRKAFLLSNFVSYTHDNSLWGPTGPLDGNRLQITLGNTVDIHHSNVNFTTVMLDVRKYFRLSYRICHAIRVWGQFNQGKEPLPFVMGGSWDLRGYKLWSLWGTKLALISNELRFPFIDQFYMHFPFGGIGLNSIRGALFVDAGNVWDDHFDEIKGSLGFGIRFTLGGYLALRFDIGKKTNFKKIYPKTFTQFFFGWDF